MIDFILGVIVTIIVGVILFFITIYRMDWPG